MVFMEVRSKVRDYLAIDFCVGGWVNFAWSQLVDLDRFGSCANLIYGGVTY